MRLITRFASLSAGLFLLSALALTQDAGQIHYLYFGLSGPVGPILRLIWSPDSREILVLASDGSFIVDVEGEAAGRVEVPEIPAGAGGSVPAGAGLLLLMVPLGQAGLARLMVRSRRSR
jgi:hypothetical protein